MNINFMNKKDEPIKISETPLVSGNVENTEKAIVLGKRLSGTAERIAVHYRKSEETETTLFADAAGKIEDSDFVNIFNSLNSDEKVFVWRIIRNDFYLSFAKGCELEGIQLIIFATGFTKKISGGGELTAKQWEEVKAFKNSDSIAKNNFAAYRSRCKIAFLRLCKMLGLVTPEELSLHSKKGKDNVTKENDTVRLSDLTNENKIAELIEKIEEAIRVLEKKQESLNKISNNKDSSVEEVKQNNEISINSLQAMVDGYHDYWNSIDDAINNN
jgi:hypothetical protein